MLHGERDPAALHSVKPGQFQGKRASIALRDSWRYRRVPHVTGRTRHVGVRTKSPYYNTAPRGVQEVANSRDHIRPMSSCTYQLSVTGQNFLLVDLLPSSTHPVMLTTSIFYSHLKLGNNNQVKATTL